MWETWQFGPLELRVSRSAGGCLTRVLLPSMPPERLDSKSLKEALEALQRMPVPPPKDPSEARFRSALEAIRPGSVATYGELARICASSPRGIASRCASNPLLLRLPCHRVVAAHGPGGYQGGAAWKAVLLGLESGMR